MISVTVPAGDALKVNNKPWHSVSQGNRESVSSLLVSMDQIGLECTRALESRHDSSTQQQTVLYSTSGFILFDFFELMNKNELKFIRNIILFYVCWSRWEFRPLFSKCSRCPSLSSSVFYHCNVPNLQNKICNYVIVCYYHTHEGHHW